jgi:hypothetical protein
MPEETAVLEPEVNDADVAGSDGAVEVDDAETSVDENPELEESKVDETESEEGEAVDEHANDPEDALDEEEDDDEPQAVISESLFQAAGELGVSRALAETFPDEESLTLHLRSVSIAKAGVEPTPSPSDQPAPETFSLTAFEMKVPANIDDYDEGAANLFKQVVQANEHLNQQYAKIQAAIKRVEGVSAGVTELGRQQELMGGAMVRLHFDRQIERMADVDEDVAIRYGAGPAGELDPDSKEVRRRDKLRSTWTRVRAELTRQNVGFTESGLLERAMDEMRLTRQRKGTVVSSKAKTLAKKAPAKEPARAISRPTPRTQTSSPGSYEERRARVVGKIDQILERAAIKERR